MLKLLYVSTYHFVFGNVEVGQHFTDIRPRRARSGSVIVIKLGMYYVFARKICTSSLSVLRIWKRTLQTKLCRSIRTFLSVVRISSKFLGTRVGSLTNFPTLDAPCGRVSQNFKVRKQ